MVESIRELGEQTERETRYYLSSLDLTADKLGLIVRDHWAVENSLHWVLDMVFRDDECRVRTGNAAANFTALKHMALSLLRHPNNRLPIRARRKAAAWDDGFLTSFMAS